MCENPHTLNFNWNDLKSFLAIVRTGRLTSAALQLQIDHSTLSRRVAALEKALQVKLFDRHPTGYLLTPAGDRLFAEAERIERTALQISSELFDAGSRMTGAIRVAIPEGLGTYFLSRKLAAFSAMHPEVTVELIADPGPVSLAKRQADVAITMSRPKAGPLKARKLADYEYGLYGSTELLDDVLISTLDQAARFRLIGYIDDLIPTPKHDYIKEVFGNGRAHLAVSNILTQISATTSGYGICILPCFMASRHKSLIRILPDNVNFTRTYWAVTHEEVRAPARVKAFTDFLHDMVRSCRTEFLPSE